MTWEDIVNRQQGIVNFTEELISAIGKTRVLVVGAGETVRSSTSSCG